MFFIAFLCLGQPKFLSLNIIIMNQHTPSTAVHMPLSGLSTFDCSAWIQLFSSLLRSYVQIVDGLPLLRSWFVTWKHCWCWVFALMLLLRLGLSRHWYHSILFLAYENITLENVFVFHRLPIQVRFSFEANWVRCSSIFEIRYLGIHFCGLNQFHYFWYSSKFMTKFVMILDLDLA